MDIDLENYGREPEPAAATQTTVDPNTYTQEEGEYVYQEFLEPKQEEVKEPIVQQEKPPEITNPQAENFRALREEFDRQKIEREAEKREYQLQLDLLRANQQPQRQQQQPKPQDLFGDLKDDDIPNVGEMKRVLAEREAMYQARIEELQLQQQYPDYQEVLDKYTAPLVKQKPHLAEGFNGATNKALYAYELGLMAKQAQAAQMQVQAPSPTPPIPPRQPSVDAQRIIDNAAKPRTLSQAGGSSTLSKSDYFASMSDADFMKYASKNLEAI